jgi:hypothetical protein
MYIYLRSHKLVPWVNSTPTEPLFKRIFVPTGTNQCLALATQARSF